MEVRREKVLVILERRKNLLGHAVGWLRATCDLWSFVLNESSQPWPWVSASLIQYLGQVQGNWKVRYNETQFFKANMMGKKKYKEIESIRGDNNEVTRNLNY